MPRTSFVNHSYFSDLGQRIASVPSRLTITCSSRCHTCTRTMARSTSRVAPHLPRTLPLPRVPSFPPDVVVPVLRVSAPLLPVSRLLSHVLSSSSSSCVFMLEPKAPCVRTQGSLVHTQAQVLRKINDSCAFSIITHSPGERQSHTGLNIQLQRHGNVWSSPSQKFGFVFVGSIITSHYTRLL